MYKESFGNSQIVLLYQYLGIESESREAIANPDTVMLLPIQIQLKPVRIFATEYPAWSLIGDTKNRPVDQCFGSQSFCPDLDRTYFP